MSMRTSALQFAAIGMAASSVFPSTSNINSNNLPGLRRLDSFVRLLRVHPRWSSYILSCTLSIFLFVLCISSASATTITASATAVGAGDPTPVSATVDNEVDALYLVYRATSPASLQNTWNTNSMTGSAYAYTGVLPALPAGTVIEWFVTDGTSVSATSTTTLAAVPDYNRYHDGVLVANSTYGWQQVNGSNYVAQTPSGRYWKANGVRPASTAAQAGGSFVDTSIGMAYPAIGFENLPLSADPYIMSPKLDGGVGTIDFRSKLMGNTVKSSEIAVQVAYTSEEPLEEEWNNVAVYNYGTRY